MPAHKSEKILAVCGIRGTVLSSRRFSDTVWTPFAAGPFLLGFRERALIPTYNCAALGDLAIFFAMITQGKAKPVAVVDDDDLMRGALLGLLKAVGLPAREFASAEDFLNSGLQHEAGCLIADIRMPGISGLELQAKLNADRCRIPIIFITAHGDEKMRMQAMRGGAVEFLAKPFDDEALLESIRAALNS